MPKLWNLPVWNLANIVKYGQLAKVGLELIGQLKIKEFGPQEFI